MEGDKSEEGLPTEALTFNQVQGTARLGIMAVWPLDALLYRISLPIRPPRKPQSVQLWGFRLCEGRIHDRQFIALFEKAAVLCTKVFIL